MGTLGAFGCAVGVRDWRASVACLISISTLGPGDPPTAQKIPQLQATARGNFQLLSRYICSLSDVYSPLVLTPPWALAALQGTRAPARRERTINRGDNAQGRSARWSPQHHHGAGDYGATVGQLSMPCPTMLPRIVSGSRARRSGARVWYGQGTVRIKKMNAHPIDAGGCPLSTPSQTVSVREWVVKTATTRHITHRLGM